MKARLLKKLLNNTGYIVNNNKEYIAVGSPLCHDLISVNKKTLQLKYAIDTWKEGRECLVKKANGKGELLFIWDKLQELIDSGQIKDIIEGTDEVENPLPVFTVIDGELVSTFTDEYDWPNTTINGDIMYNNTYFKTKEEAATYGIKNSEYWIKNGYEKLPEYEEKVQKIKDGIQREKEIIKRLSKLLNKE